MTQYGVIGHDFGVVEAKDDTHEADLAVAYKSSKERRYDEFSGEAYDVTVKRLDTSCAEGERIGSYINYVSKCAEGSYLRGDDPLNIDFLGYADWRAAHNV